MQFRLAILTLLIICCSPVALLAAETKDIKYQFKNSEPVVFSHKVHLAKYNNNCKVCHNAIFNLSKPTRYTMADMEKTKSCGACHTGVKAFSVADDKSCVKCHAGKPRNVEYKVPGAGKTVFSHYTHLAKTDNKCRACHSKIITGRDGRVTMEQMEKGKTCGACHDGKKAFTVAGNCGTCHQGMKTREITFKSKGVTDALFSHKLHTESYSCKECHTKIYPYKAGVKSYTMAQMGQGKSCGVCHNGKEAFTAMGDCQKCHKGYKPGEITFKTSVGQAKFSHKEHLENYKCADCHTKVFPYQAGAKKYTMEQMAEGKSCGACHNGKDAFSSQDDCIKCHTSWSK